MKYYQALDDAYDYFNKFATIKGELFTEKERNSKIGYIDDSHFRIVDINKNHTFKSFGARFPLHSLPEYINF